MKKLLLIIAILIFALSANARSKKTAPIADTSLATCILHIESQPGFPGGDEAFKKFLAKNLKWPPGDIDAEGSVIITFVVQKDGRTTGFKVLRSIHPLFDAEALRVLKKQPKWKPAIQNGKPIARQYTVPVRFSVPQ